MFSFVKRPGFGSNKLLIEFRKGAGSNEMVSALREALSTIGSMCLEKEDIWQNDEFLYQMKCNSGRFEISSTDDDIFILSDKNQEAIEAIEAALLSTGKFEKEEVDFGYYTHLPSV